MTTYLQYLGLISCCILYTSQTTLKTPFTFEEKVIVLRKQNDLRRAIGAANMNKLYWHTGLEKLAQKWADNCEWRHNDNRHNIPGLGYKWVGENLYIGSFYNDPTRSLMQWYEEKNNLIDQTMNCMKNKRCGHFTQMVWYNAERVGCAIQHCNPMKLSIVKNGYFVVCEYGPLGNTPGEYYYKKGTPCTDCQAGSTCVDKLCARPQCNGVQCAHGKLVVDVCMCNCTGSGYKGEKCEIPTLSGGVIHNDGSPNMDSAGSSLGSSLLVSFVIYRFAIKLFTTWSEP